MNSEASMNLQQMFVFFERMYGLNNRVIVTSLVEHVGYLSYMTGRLQDAIRKQDVDAGLVKVRIANVIARTFAVASFFNRGTEEFAFAHHVCLKYPVNRCGYCHQMKCECDVAEREKHVEPEVVDSVQLQWSLRGFQSHLNRIYGVVNRTQGVDNAVLRLMAEVTEIQSLAQGLGVLHLNAHLRLRLYGLEIADVLAWTLAVAILKDIDAYEAVMSVYGDGCPGCKDQSKGGPCQCTEVYVKAGLPLHALEAVGSVPSSTS